TPRCSRIASALRLPVQLDDANLCSRKLLKKPTGARQGIENSLIGAVAHGQQDHLGRKTEHLQQIAEIIIPGNDDKSVRPRIFPPSPVISLLETQHGNLG